MAASSSIVVQSSPTIPMPNPQAIGGKLHLLAIRIVHGGDRKFFARSTKFTSTPENDLGFYFMKSPKEASRGGAGYDVSGGGSWFGLSIKVTIMIMDWAMKVCRSGCSQSFGTW